MNRLKGAGSSEHQGPSLRLRPTVTTFDLRCAWTTVHSGIPWRPVQTDSWPHAQRFRCMVWVGVLTGLRGYVLLLPGRQLTLRTTTLPPRISKEKVTYKCNCLMRFPPILCLWLHQPLKLLKWSGKCTKEFFLKRGNKTRILPKVETKFPLKELSYVAGIPQPVHLPPSWMILTIRYAVRRCVPWA